MQRMSNKNPLVQTEEGISYTYILALRELGSLTCLLETVLAAFLLTRITRNEACLLECRAQLCVHLNQCACDAVTDRTRLTGRTS